MVVDPTTNRLYVADGYGNRRVLIVDADTGKYTRPGKTRDSLLNGAGSSLAVRVHPARGRLGGNAGCDVSELTG